MPGLHASRIAGTCSAAHFNCERPTGHDHQDDGLARGYDGLEKLLLGAGETQMHAAGGFAFHPVGALAQGQNGHVGLLGGFHGLGNGPGVVGNGVAASGGGNGAAKVHLVEHDFILAGKQSAALGVEQPIAEALG